MVFGRILSGRNLRAAFAVAMALGAATAGSRSANAATPPCQPCAGLQAADPLDLLDGLSGEPALEDEERLYVAWRAELDGSANAEAAGRLEEAGATPWPRLIFRTAPPLAANAEQLDAELAEAARLARAATARSHFQIDWEPPAGDPRSYAAAEYAFLLKRASVAVKGAQPEARVLTAPLGSDPDWVRELYAEDIAAYIEGATIADGAAEDVAAVLATVTDVDAGRPVALVGKAFPAEPLASLADAAAAAAMGFTATLFDLGADPDTADADLAAAVAPLKLMAREFQGDLALDPYSEPTGALDGWAFVRGEDLGLRVIVKPHQPTDEVVATFSDSGLRRPSRVDPETGEAVELFGLRRTADGLAVPVSQPGAVVVLRMERLTASEIEGIQGLEEEVLVTTERQLPVEEILRRLQAFEDSQARMLKTYRALNTTHLRYQAGTGGQTIETTFRGPFFFRRGGGFDWAWDDFLINGVRWRSKRIPEIPLIQPEKATTAPVDISFTREYRYTLRGTELVGDRDCWVVDFEPAAAVEPGESLYRGTVWVDREIFARVKTRAIQLGLEGDVLSNDESTFFSPVDASGEAADWSAESYFMPLRLVGQQLWSILSATIAVEREVLLTAVAINAEDFEDARQLALASESTMVRDTEAGLRYLVPDEETGGRVVKDEVDSARRFVVGGILHDESQDFPIPLAGMNWLWFDLKDTGTQADVFVAGPLITVAATKPGFKGSKFDLGFDAFALAIAGTDTLFRDGVEVKAEDVETMNPNVDLKIGRPLGSFAKVDLAYQLGYARFSRADDTAEEFVLPTDHLNHTLSLTTRYNRRGYRLRGEVSHTMRGEWEPWGIPGGNDFELGDDEFSKWSLALGKTWHLPKFLKFGAEIEYVNGSHLDRFSKYDVGFFSDINVRGYQSDKVRAEEAVAAHLNYGFGVGSVFRVDFVADAAWVTDEEAGFDQELLVGAGIAGTFVGPWQTVVRMDVGVAVDGPDDGFGAFLAVLKPLR